MLSRGGVRGGNISGRGAVASRGRARGGVPRANAAVFQHPLGATGIDFRMRRAGAPIAGVRTAEHRRRPDRDRGDDERVASRRDSTRVRTQPRVAQGASVEMVFRTLWCGWTANPGSNLRRRFPSPAGKFRSCSARDPPGTCRQWDTSVGRPSCPGKLAREASEPVSASARRFSFHRRANRRRRVTPRARASVLRNLREQQFLPSSSCRGDGSSSPSRPSRLRPAPRRSFPATRPQRNPPPPADLRSTPASSSLPALVHQRA